MKNIATITQDGLEGSIELIKFLKECNDDLYEAIIALVGNSATVFITGGLITEAGGNTTVTDGIILKDGKLYRFTGGTVAGTPSGLNVLFESNLAPGYDPVYFDGDPIPKDIYLANTARIDATGSIVLSTIGYVTDMITAKPILDAVAGKAGKNAKSTFTGVTAGTGFSFDAINQFYEYEDGTIKVYCTLSFTGNKPANSALLRNLPPWGGAGKIIPVKFIGPGGASIIVNCEFILDVLLTLSAVNSPYNDCIITFEYKKA